MAPKNRCEWVAGKPDYYIAYHDHVWGVPEHNDQRLFQWLALESFHVGLSWQLVLSKLSAFMEAFDHFHIETVAQYGERDIQRCMANQDIIRHRGKIEATITNAKCIQTIQAEWGSLDAYLWHFTQGEVVYRAAGTEMNTRSELSDQVTQDMKERGFKFIGSVTIYSYLQAIGVINDHEDTCQWR